jgi:uncharacterized protein
MTDTAVKYRPGDVVTLKAVRAGDMGVWLDAGTGNTSDDILLHKLQQTTPVRVGDEVRVYLYLDPHKRLTASMKLPKMHEGQLGYVKVLNVTRDGGFVDIGAERGVFLPYTEMQGRVHAGQFVWVKLYRDKSGRPAVTMRVDKEMARLAKPVVDKKVGDIVTGTIYNITRDGFFLFTPERHIAFLHRSEADSKRYLSFGEEVTAALPSSVPTGMSMCPCASRKKTPCWTTQPASWKSCSPATERCPIVMIHACGNYQSQVRYFQGSLQAGPGPFDETGKNRAG